MDHLDWVPFTDAIKGCQHPGVVQLMDSHENDPNEEVLLFLADQLDALTDETGSHDAAIEWASTEYDLPIELLARVYYDDRSALADLVRAKRKLPSMRRGKRTPLSRLLAALHGMRFQDESSWEKGKRTLLQIAEAMGPKFFRRVMPIIRLAKTPQEAKTSLLEFRSSRKATVGGTWSETEKLETARRLAAMGQGDFQGNVFGFSITSAPETLRDFGLTQSTVRSKQATHAVLTAMRKAKIRVARVDGYEVGDQVFVNAQLRAPKSVVAGLQRQVQEVMPDVGLQFRGL